MANQIPPLEPPFVQVEGTFNFRIVGGYSLAADPTLRVKPNLLFRSGELSDITGHGIETLASLGITKVIDLRSDKEIEMWKTPTPHLPGIKIERTSIHTTEVTMDHKDLATHFQNFETNGLSSLLVKYSRYLEQLRPSIEATIRHILEDANHPPLIHCTAGKDRTGLAVAVILLLLGVSETEIAEEYALTTIGLGPVNEKLAARLSSDLVKANPVGVQHLFSSRAETMIAACRMIQEVYNGAEGYILNKTSLTPEDITTFREKVLIKDPAKSFASPT